MPNRKNAFPYGILACVFCIALALPVLAQTNATGANMTKPAEVLRDGQHDFDFEIGTWKTHLKRLVHPLSGSSEWTEYEGITTVRKVWDGRANLVELIADGPAGHFEGLNLRLYNPQSRQWSLNFASVRGGTLGPPTIGEFRNGRGEFHNQEEFNGRAVLVRFVIIPVDADTIRFEQSFSDDGGKTWEVNWIATDTRMNQPPELFDSLDEKIDPGSGRGAPRDSLIDRAPAPLRQR